MDKLILDSHAALNGSQHLEFLVKKDLLNPISLPELEQLYAKRASHALDNTSTDTSPADLIEEIEQSDDRILLKMSDAKRLATILDAPELALEAERAIVQVSEQLQARKEKTQDNDIRDEKKKS